MEFISRSPNSSMTLQGYHVSVVGTFSLIIRNVVEYVILEIGFGAYDIVCKFLLKYLNSAKKSAPAAFILACTTLPTESSQMSYFCWSRKYNN